MVEKMFSYITADNIITTIILALQTVAISNPWIVSRKE